MRAGSRKLAFAFVAIGLISDRVVMTTVVRLVKYDPQGDIRAQAHAVHVPSSVGISGTLKTRFRQTLQVVGLECRRKYRCRHVFFLPRARHKDAHTDRYCRLLGYPRCGKTPLPILSTYPRHNSGLHVIPEIICLQSAGVRRIASAIVKFFVKRQKSRRLGPTRASAYSNNDTPTGTVVRPVISATIRASSPFSEVSIFTSPLTTRSR